VSDSGLNAEADQLAGAFAAAKGAELVLQEDLGGLAAVPVGKTVAIVQTPFEALATGAVRA
jgi:hypothetical protein